MSLARRTIAIPLRPRSLVSCSSALALLVVGCLEDATLVTTDAGEGVATVDAGVSAVEETLAPEADAPPSWMVKSEDGDRCLEIAADDSDMARPIHAAPCHGGWNQRWTHYLDGTLRNRYRGTERCLDIARDGAVLVASPCEDGRPGQRWDWQFSFGPIVSQVSRRCVELDRDDPSWSHVDMAGCTGQRWHDGYRQ